MKFEVNNFGKIKKADLDLKPLSIIVGKNSIGKSHLLQCFYAWAKFTKTFGSNMSAGYKLRYIRPDTLRYVLGKRKTSNIVEQFRNSKEEIIISGEMIKEILSILPDFPVGRRLSRRIKKFDPDPKLYRSLLIEEIESTFGTTINSLVDKQMNINFRSDYFNSTFKYNSQNEEGKNKKKSEINFYFPEFIIHVNYKIKYFYIDPKQIEIKFPNKKRRYLLTDFDKKSAKEQQFSIQSIKDDEKYIFTILASIIRRIVNTFWDIFVFSVRVFNQNIYYLAAARSGMLQAHKSLASTMMKLSRFAGLTRDAFPLLPGSQIDFIIEFLQIGDKKLKREFDTEDEEEFYLNLDKMVHFLENKILSGSLIVKEESTGYPLILFQQEENSYELHTSSSMVAELAPIYLLYKYFKVEEGDYIIIEEPESHLHPYLASFMARFLVRSVNMGLRIIVTTHSDYFLKEVENLIKASSLSAEELKSFGLENSDTINPSEVSLHLLSESESGGSISNKISVNKHGFDDEIFEKVIDELYSRTLSISNRVDVGNKDE